MFRMNETTHAFSISKSKTYNKHYVPIFLKIALLQDARHLYSSLLRTYIYRLLMHCVTKAYTYLLSPHKYTLSKNALSDQNYILTVTIY